jgi:hypothetical protein
MPKMLMMEDDGVSQPAVPLNYAEQLQLQKALLQQQQQQQQQQQTMLVAAPEASATSQQEKEEEPSHGNTKTYL